jgi:hypothetical protein
MTLPLAHSPDGSSSLRRLGASKLWQEPHPLAFRFLAALIT